MMNLPKLLRLFMNEINSILIPFQLFQFMNRNAERPTDLKDLELKAHCTSS